MTACKRTTGMAEKILTMMSWSESYWQSLRPRAIKPRHVQHLVWDIGYLHSAYISRPMKRHRGLEELDGRASSVGFISVRGTGGVFSDLAESFIVYCHVSRWSCCAAFSFDAGSVVSGIYPV